MKKYLVYVDYQMKVQFGVKIQKKRPIQFSRQKNFEKLELLG